ncbi:lipoprotein-releasing ABC transporter permease subunit [Sphingomonas psychrolutea]|uniref:Multidrug ABC transporter substrate-binding protein n=1 Tax=Sphingomonas psychrolutea TaxID=1259676 RepID=A0ABQ1GZA2_9SPHN|nr:lipoprotein-releasing ABC transporter permease subunit [Sphingomonas psychrolutea]GGA52732.1 multidrug ABC transporter substrate-binding protein [Sphingomonas psychrolutea]
MFLSRYERMIARRYLLPGKGEAFILIVAAFSLGAVTLGVFALVVTMSVMNGFRAELFDKIVGLNGHAVVQAYGGQMRDWRDIVKLSEATKGVTSATPLIEQPLMTTYNGRVEGVLLRGMRVADICTNKTIGSKVVMGSLASLTPGSGRIAIGSGLADSLGAVVGSQISLISPQGQTTPFGTVPRIVQYTVGAIFTIGVSDYDKIYVIMPMEDAQTLLMLGDSVGMVELQTTDPDRVGQILAPLSDKIGNRGVVQDWRMMNAQLFEALSVERVVMFCLLSLIILVAAFNIASSLIMLVRAKTRDIAILRTMGASRNGLLRIFMTVGTTIGSLGIVLGLLLAGIALTFRQGVVDLIQRISGQNIWDPQVRFLTELPAKTNPVEVVAIVLIALLLTFLATLYPAFKAASTDPVQVLRYD